MDLKKLLMKEKYASLILIYYSSSGMSFYRNYGTTQMDKFDSLLFNK